MSDSHTSLSADEIRQRLAQYRWYHTIPVTPEISTPGEPNYAITHPPVLRLMDKIDFGGKRVLDIGCRDGLFSLEAEQRGAAEVLGIDRSISEGAVEFLLPFKRSKVQMREQGLFELDPGADGQFDVVLFLGVLYHLRYPFQALRVIADMLKDGGQLIVETGIYADDDKRPLLFCPVGEESPYEASSPTFFNRKGMSDTLKSFGLRVTEMVYRRDDHSKVRDGRVIRMSFLCTKDPVLWQQFPHDYWLGGARQGWKKKLE